MQAREEQRPFVQKTIESVERGHGKPEVDSAAGKQFASHFGRKELQTAVEGQCLFKKKFFFKIISVKKLPGQSHFRLSIKLNPWVCD